MPTEQIHDGDPAHQQWAKTMINHKLNVDNMRVFYPKPKRNGKKPLHNASHTFVLPCFDLIGSRDPPKPQFFHYHAGYWFTARDNVQIKAKPLTCTQVSAPQYNEEVVKGVTYFKVPLTDVWENRAAFVGPDKGVRMNCVFYDMSQNPNKAPLNLDIWYNVKILEDHRVVFLE